MRVGCWDVGIGMARKGMAGRWRDRFEGLVNHGTDWRRMAARGKCHRQGKRISGRIESPSAPAGRNGEPVPLLGRGSCVQVSPPPDLTRAFGADPVEHHSPLQHLSEPLLAAATLSHPLRHRMLHAVASFTNAAYLARFRFPNPVVIMSRPHYRVGNFVQDGVLDVRTRGRQAITHRQVDTPFTVTTHTGAGRRQVKSETPSLGQSSIG